VRIGQPSPISDYELPHGFETFLEDAWEAFTRRSLSFKCIDPGAHNSDSREVFLFSLLAKEFSKHQGRASTKSSKEIPAWLTKIG
jgi:hypothetical protein